MLEIAENLQIQQLPIVDSCGCGTASKQPSVLKLGLVYVTFGLLEQCHLFLVPVHNKQKMKGFTQGSTILERSNTSTQTLPKGNS
ncbi:hypothetical protein GQ457_03G035890 [Hibiscus cannabinus]